MKNVKKVVENAVKVKAITPHSDTIQKPLLRRLPDKNAKKIVTTLIQLYATLRYGYVHAAFHKCCGYEYVLFQWR